MFNIKIVARGDPVRPGGAVTTGEERGSRASEHNSLYLGSFVVFGVTKRI